MTAKSYLMRDISTVSRRMLTDELMLATLNQHREYSIGPDTPPITGYVYVQGCLLVTCDPPSSPLFGTMTTRLYLPLTNASEPDTYSYSEESK